MPFVVAGVAIRESCALLIHMTVTQTVSTAGLAGRSRDLEAVSSRFTPAQTQPVQDERDHNDGTPRIPQKPTWPCNVHTCT